MRTNRSLSIVIRPGIRAESWSIDEHSSDDQRPVDDFFTIILRYCNRVDNVTGTLKLKRESSDWQFDVMGWLAHLNVDVNAWDAIIDIVGESCESLITDVRESGRTSLVFRIMVCQYEEWEEEYHDYELMYLGIEQDSETEEEEDYEPMHPDNLDTDWIEQYCDPDRIKSILQDGGVKFANGGHSGTISNCSICLEEFGMSNNVATLPCSHIYHEQCMIRWAFQGKRTCPLCRLEIKLNFIGKTL
ncbi:uncharacterized protein LOC110721857 isoform X2 [Chenopodium quinoa]|uniref:uncharacterized protein LOC110721857 isoform X2 n=1 Tax=Chenopodium quinoa TaxID=63459 RepID=UPI000B773BED|nr:uncharacterized protein LOC110721857 isoform X2 [Chenopodium quinoa]